MPLFQKKPARKPRRKVVPVAPPPPKAEPPKAGYGDTARSFFKGALDDAKASKCEIAFDKLVEGISYAGMAEADAKAAGREGSDFARETLEAVTRFKTACKVK